MHRAQTPQELLDQPLLHDLRGTRIGVAVSGGGDSVALLHLMHALNAFDLHAITVDHGLRAESADEAQGVARMAHDLGIPHHIATWVDRPGRGNLSDNARRARKALIAQWARERDISHIALGHTADDQAETFLMRLARGSGLQGLSAMDPVVAEDGVRWLRPLMHTRRAELRRYLKDHKITWIDDPTNEDARFDRVKMRKAMSTLGDAGISVPDIAKTTHRLRSAKQVLFTATRDLGLAVSTITKAGEILLDHGRLMSAQHSLKLRLLSEAIRVVSGSYYAPRAHAVSQMLEALSDDTFKGTSLHGCLIRLETAQIAIRREPSAVGQDVGLGRLWDDRWIVKGPDSEGLTISALGAPGLTVLENWRNSGFKRESLVTTPAIWRGDTLIAAPIIQNECEYVAELQINNPFFTP